ncbi:MAG: UDP-N-acetyl-D-mannosaminuronic acid transferase [Candidatus Roseilinea sp.]|nr:MAG: UDP-N-acetyl-D-mannosaminuronic acid transferase [Candidatus Roseilinea sp.]
MRPTLDVWPWPSQHASAPAVHLLGVRVHILPLVGLIAHITACATSDCRMIVAYVNAHGLNLAHEQPALREFFNDIATVVFCDGFGVRWGARLAGLPTPYRYTPPDWIGELCTACVNHRLSLYLLGGQPGIAERAADVLRRQYTSLAIAGVHHGHFDKRPNSHENCDVLAKIEAVRPDILLVGFGMPAQEYWLRDNWDRMPHVKVAITVGALFDYVSGNARRAPRWMTDHGLEWLGRLLAEPGRLWRRYLIGNPLFLARVLRQRLGRRPRRE